MLTALLGVSSAEAQNKKNKDTSEVITISTTIVDENKEPIVNAQMITREGAVSDYTDAAGDVTIQAKSDGIILIEALGYDDVVIDLTKGFVPTEVVMKKVGILETSRDMVERADERKQKLATFTGAQSSITGEELESYVDYSLSNAFQGRFAGAVVSATSGNHGNNNSGIFIRGLHRNDTNGVMVVVDGMERLYDDISPEEIESITILKDAVGKILYGSRGANGVMVITTKRGVANKRVARISAQTGVMVATRTAKYLDSYEYATLYNEACENDGIAKMYSDSMLEGYKNSTGENDLYYPNVDYSDYFLNNSVNFTKATLDMSGGNNKIQYAVIGSYLGGNGYESTGPTSTMNRVNIRGSMNVNITDKIRFVANSAAVFENRDYGNLDGNTIYNRVASYLPNEAPLIIDADLVGWEESSVPYFGASKRVTANLLADTAYGGNMSENYITSQTNIGLRFDLGDYVEGLTFGSDFMFDNYEYFQYGQTDQYATYALVGTGDDGTPILQQVRSTTLESEDSRESYSSNRTTNWRAMFNYGKSFGNHDIDAGLAYNYYYYENIGVTQDIVNTYATLSVNYVYDDKYTAEGSFAYLGSNRFNANNRYFMSRAIGLGWILSKENFLSDNKYVDFLKLKASYGVIGYDEAIDYDLGSYDWGNESTTSFGEGNTSSTATFEIINVASDIDWEYTREFNIGVEGYFLGGRLRGELNYFHETRKDMVSAVNYKVADVISTFIEYDNVGSVRNSGMDGYLEWSDRRGNLSYTVGVNALLSKNKILEWNEVNYPDSYNASVVGQSTSAIYGYEAIGLFGTNGIDVATHPEQRLGDYQDGDIAYRDLNGDNIIDESDRSVIGNSHPTGTFGLNINLNYKRWGLYLLGTAEVGIQTMKSNGYYWIDGLSKYSEIVNDRWHAENNPDGTYPRLTTLTASNNLVNSTFWLDSAAYFRLKNAQLSYTFDFKSPNSAFDKVKLFVNATNLFVLSSIKELDPEVLEAGVTNYPVSTAITGGINVTF
ncbi:MAG: SusC/RagA family TonB-linked outer membrane protein [Rikenellaceae bacterium]